ncbi:MAG: class I SAM-dependent methyltransferase [Alphaproteobacteria bacterium]
MAKGKVEAPVEVYDDMYESETAYSRPYNKSLYYPMFLKVLEELKRLSTTNVLEVGCGGGIFAQMLIEHSDIQYRGFDFSVNGIKKAMERNAGSDLFSIGNALDEASYFGPFDTIVCTEVLEHIERDLDVVRLWPHGVNCVCSVPNFDYPTHVRVFKDESDVLNRYGELIDIDSITRVARPLFKGQTLQGYFQELRWKRDKPARFLAMLGYKVFENYAGWFVFSGKRK